MGCACGKPEYPEQEAGRPQAKVLSTAKSGKVAVGTPVKNVSAEERRAKQLAAAEDRARKEAQRGLGPGSKRSEELSESAKRQELIGRIQAHYASIRQDVPMGLNLASPEQLRKHLDAIKKNSGTIGDILDP